VPSRSNDCSIWPSEDESAVVVGDGRHLAMDEGMVMPTQEDGIGQVCRASLFPGQGMVDLTVLDRLRAPRIPAGSISGDYSASLPRCEQTLASPRVENFPGRREHDAANRRVACQPGKLRHRQCGSIVKSGRLCSGQSLQIDCRGNDRQEGAELLPLPANLFQTRAGPPLTARLNAPPRSIAVHTVIGPTSFGGADAARVDASGCCDAAFEH